MSLRSSWRRSHGLCLDRVPRVLDRHRLRVEWIQLSYTALDHPSAKLYLELMGLVKVCDVCTHDAALYARGWARRLLQLWILWCRIRIVYYLEMVDRGALQRPREGCYWRELKAAQDWSA